PPSPDPTLVPSRCRGRTRTTEPRRPARRARVNGKEQGDVRGPGRQQPAGAPSCRSRPGVPSLPALSPVVPRLVGPGGPAHGKLVQITFEAALPGECHDR